MDQCNFCHFANCHLKPMPWPLAQGTVRARTEVQLDWVLYSTKCNLHKGRAPVQVATVSHNIQFKCVLSTSLFLQLALCFCHRDHALSPVACTGGYQIATGSYCLVSHIAHCTLVLYDDAPCVSVVCIQRQLLLFACKYFFRWFERIYFL